MVILVPDWLHHGGKGKKNKCNEDIGPLLASSDGTDTSSSQATQLLCSQPDHILLCKGMKPSNWSPFSLKNKYTKQVKLNAKTYVKTAT